MIEAASGLPANQQAAANGSVPPSRQVITSIQRLPSQSSQVKKQPSQRTTNKPPLSSVQGRSKKSSSPIKSGTSAQSNITLLQSGVIQWGSWLRHTGRSENREEQATVDSKQEQRKSLTQSQVQSQTQSQGQSQNPSQNPNQPQTQNQSQNQSHSQGPKQAPPANQHSGQGNNQYNQSLSQYSISIPKDAEGGQEGNYSYTAPEEDHGKGKGRNRSQETPTGHQVVRDTFPNLVSPAMQPMSAIPTVPAMSSMMVPGHYPPIYGRHGYGDLINPEAPTMAIPPTYHYSHGSDRPMTGNNEALTRPVSGRGRSGSISESVGTAIEYAEPTQVFPQHVPSMVPLTDMNQNVAYSSSSSLQDPQNNTSTVQVHANSEFPFDFNLEMDGANLASSVVEPPHPLYPRNDVYLDRSVYRDSMRQPFPSDEHGAMQASFYQVPHPHSVQFDQYISHPHINDDRRIRDDRMEGEMMQRSNSTSSLESSVRNHGLAMPKDMVPSSDSLHSSADLSDAPIS